MTRMEELTQTQIILLTLLVSFITSIATGIITTSLLAEAPTSVTQTINRVVEHTIEKVVPPTETNGGGKTVKEVTIITEEDAVIDAIDKANKSVVRIYQPTITNDPRGEFYGLGVIINEGGLVVSDLRNPKPNQLYTITLSDGTTLEAHPVDVGTENNVGVFRLTPDTTHKTFIPAVVSGNEPKLGQSIIAVEGESKNAVALGRVLSLISGSETNTGGDPVSVAYAVNTDINKSGELAGAPLFNLSGELLGIKTSNFDLSLSEGKYTTVVPINRAVSKAR